MTIARIAADQRRVEGVIERGPRAHPYWCSAMNSMRPRQTLRGNYRRIEDGLIYLAQKYGEQSPQGFPALDKTIERAQRYMSVRHKTLYNRYVRWAEMGVFERLFEDLTKTEGLREEIIVIDATHLKAHRTASSLKKAGDEPRLIGRTKGGLNSKLHAICDVQGRPVRLLLTEGQCSDFKGAKILLPNLPQASALIGDKGYDSNQIRQALSYKEITPCIPPKKNRKAPIDCCKKLYKKRHPIENLFAKLKDWRRSATRYERCAHTSRSAIYIRNNHILAMSPESR